jgi:hypothetical protein
MGLGASELGSTFNSQQNWAWPAREFIYYNTYISIKKHTVLKTHTHIQEKTIFQKQFRRRQAMET